MPQKSTVKSKKWPREQLSTDGMQAVSFAQDASFGANLIAWYHRHGRHDLPWQGVTDPYRRWVSEIMLQQTRVATVIPYYERFIERFPDIFSLAAAELDEVLEDWTGLGYYARARNLHRTARIVVREHAGAFPKSFDQIVGFPGIGRSTAGAILAFSFGQRYPILDGNVRRILVRYHAIDGWPGDTRITRRLWALADEHTPNQGVVQYTQAIMDLGAEICLRRRPRCSHCPLAGGCKAYLKGRLDRYPASRPHKVRPVRHTTMVMVRDQCGRVLLERRPSIGIWGGLWSFPECPDGQSPQVWCREQLGLEITGDAPWDSLRHGFTHFELDILPLPARLAGTATAVDGEDRVWYKPGSPVGRGIAAPVRHLLEQLQDHPL